MAIIKDILPSTESGFTLLETLVVITIISVLAGALTLSLPWGTEGRLKREVEDMRQMLQATADKAVIEGVQMGAALTRKTYTILKYDAASHQWQPAKDALSHERRLSDDIMLSLVSDGTSVTLPMEYKENMTPHPALLFLSSGEITPSAISLRSDKASATLVTDGLAPMEILYGAER